MRKAMAREQHKLVVRAANTTDFALLPAIEAEADSLFKQVGILNLPLATTAKELSQAQCVLVAGRPPVGFARIEEIDKIAHLEQLSVLPHYGGRGLGSQLLESACDWAAKNAYVAITLITFRDIPWNAPFYARHGFEMIKDISPGLKALQKHENDLGLDSLGPRVVMRRYLTT